MAVIIQPDPVSLGPADVAEFEAEIGFTLPDDYRAFLLTYNGGTFPEPPDMAGESPYLGFYAAPSPPLEDEEASVAPGNFWDVAQFNGLLLPPERYGDLRQVYLTMRDWRHPDALLPIASQIGNAKYFLCLDGPQRGQILFPGAAYLQKYSDDEPIAPADYHRLVDSFGAMLEQLEWKLD